MIKFGIIKETKHPIDNRVLFTPKQIKELLEKYKNIDICVESSDIRCYSDEEYVNEGIRIVNDLSDCDILLGIKEVALEKLIPNKHYFFFGHIAKMQFYNKPLIRELMKKQISFSDYEYLTDSNGNRLCAFGWWAGFVGVYNSLRAYGLKTKAFNLSDALNLETIDDLINEVKDKIQVLPTILITGDGKVTEGALYFLKSIHYLKCSIVEYLEEECLTNRYVHLTLPELVQHKDSSKNFERSEFKLHPEKYISIFNKYYSKCDVFIPCHYWGANDPIYVTKQDLQKDNFKIKVIGDVTCDISGGIKSTIRPSTHNNPFYDINKLTLEEENAFENKDNLTVMAVDTLPNALPRAASEYFGEKFIQNVLLDLVNTYNKGELSRVISDATILKNGKLTEKYSYLTEYAK